MSTLAVRHIKVAVDGADANGLLVMNGGALVAVLVCLEEAFYGHDRGRWHLEAGFGRCATAQTTFADIEAALRWMAKRLDIGEEGVASAIDHFHRGS